MKNSVPSNSALAWWNLTRKQKEALQLGRRAGLYGGASAAGIGHAPYFWVQEYGEPKAAIDAQSFAATSWQAFKNQAVSLIRSYIKVR